MNTDPGGDVGENGPAMHELAGMRETLAERTICRIAIARELVALGTWLIDRAGRPRRNIVRVEDQDPGARSRENLPVNMSLNDKALNCDRQQCENENDHLSRRRAHAPRVCAVPLQHPSAVTVPDHFPHRTGRSLSAGCQIIAKHI